MSDPSSNHILTDFDDALTSLRNRVLHMASLTTRSLTNAMNGLAQRDDDLCLKAIADDEEIDQLEIQIDKEGVELLLRFQPVASDLRRVIGALKLSPNLERVGDESVSIARRARKLIRHDELPEVAWVSEMGAQAILLFKDSVDAYTRNDADLGRSLKERDKPIDAMNTDLLRRLLGQVPQNPGHLRGYLNLTFIAGHLERIGDHATNIGEEAVYAVEAEDIRHQTLAQE
jgi:phosphate transport system protein